MVRVGEEPTSPEDPPQPAEILVTGSYLHGILDIMSPLRTVTREEMQQTPYGTVQDALQLLPTNMLAGQSENFGGIGNYNRGSAPNLRGLGFGATLVLVNGRRQPVAGSSAMPGIGVFLQGGAIPCSVGVLLMSWKLTPCMASR